MNEIIEMLIKQINDKLQENLTIPQRNALVDIRTQLTKIPEDISTEDFGKEMDTARAKLTKVEENDV